MAGRPPKEKSFYNALRVALAETHTDGASTKLRAIADMLVTKAIEGEGWAIKEVADRTDGKAMQAVELTGEDGGPVNFITVYETAKTKDA